MPHIGAASNQTQCGTKGRHSSQWSARLKCNLIKIRASEERELERFMILMLARGHGEFGRVQGIKRPVSKDLKIVVPGAPVPQASLQLPRSRQSRGSSL